MDTARKAGTSLPTTPPNQPRVSHPINDSYCLVPVCTWQMTRSTDKRTLELCQTVNVNSLADHVAFVIGHQQKSSASPSVKEIKSVKGVSCVDLLSSVQPVMNVPVVAQNLPVGGRLQKFWENWASLGVRYKVIRNL